MGADLSRITFLKASVRDRFTLKDLAVLQAAVTQTGTDVRLVVIDPPTAYLGDVDDHKNGELRGLLAPLANLAHQERLAIIFNTHVNKAQGKVDAMMRVMGSVAWVNTVRAAHLFVRDPEDSNRRLFLPLKTNLGPERTGLSFTITPTVNLARVDWIAEVKVTADEVMDRQRTDHRPRGAVAAEWLIERFREQREWESENLFRRGKQEGVSRNAIFEAKRTLDLPKPRKSTVGGTTSWVWWVPENWPHLAAPENPETLATDELT